MYTRLNLEDRIVIEVSLKRGKSKSWIAKKLGRHKSTITREVNQWGYTNGINYNAVNAHERSIKQKKLCVKASKLLNNEKLLEFVIKKLRLRWSPEQISLRIKEEFPDQSEMRISKETIYTYIYVLSKGSLKKELMSYLRQKKKSRYSRKGKTDKRGTIPDMISIHERPAEVEDRTIPGHWEGDLIMGRNHQSAIGTLVERTTRTVILVKLKNKDAESVRKAYAKELLSLPKQMRITLTYDRGHEMSQHKLFTEETKIKVYFADPSSPWQRGTNENTNGLIRDYYPKGTDFSKVTKAELKKVQKELNERPRNAIGWKTPKEAFNEYLKKTDTPPSL
jgi:IS30 family transposase